ncbi:MAG: HPr family phosphocarrier protein [Bacteroides sp.]|jgi:phosphocarrier protein HPr|nr:HPr family phosphocarrier protein [Lachnospiraceae bacterium]CDA68836.1 phosphocarrier protein PtsH [Clostridium sp. CAG:510]
MKSFDYTITDEIGIHARPAGILAKKAKEYASRITITKGGKTAEAQKLMAVMSLGVKKGETVTVSAEGEDEEKAVADMETFFKENL